jgi:hypothetical protein
MAQLASGFPRTAQPWPLRVERTAGACCGETKPHSMPSSGLVHKLNECLEKATVLNGPFNGENADVAILSFAASTSAKEGSFAIPDIDQFAVYQKAIMHAYAENNGYVFRQVTSMREVRGAENTTDARWMKVKLLLDALSGNSSGGEEEEEEEEEEEKQHDAATHDAHRVPLPYATNHINDSVSASIGAWARNATYLVWIGRCSKPFIPMLVLVVLTFFM